MANEHLLKNLLVLSVYVVHFSLNNKVNLYVFLSVESVGDYKIEKFLPFHSFTFTVPFPVLPESGSLPRYPIGAQLFPPPLIFTFRFFLYNSSLCGGL